MDHSRWEGRFHGYRAVIANSVEPARDLARVEESGFQTLAHFGVNRFDIASIADEHNYGARRQDVFELLSAQGYRRNFEAVRRWDHWYVRDAGN